MVIDNNTTFDGEHIVHKDDHKIELLGSVDELSCMLGVAYGYADVKTRNLINETQAHLFMLTGLISTGAVAPVQTWIDVMELDITDWNLELPAIEGFIKPRAYLQLCRAICRRAERHAVTWNRYTGFTISQSDMLRTEKEEAYANLNLIVQFLNVLSNWLFVLARKTDHMV